MLLRPVLAVLIVAATLSGASPAMTGSAPTEQKSPALRFVVGAKPSTVAVGRPAAIDIEMYSSTGAKTPAAADTLVTLTITTLPSLDAARKDSGSAASAQAKPTSLEKQQIVLPAGVNVRRITGIFPRGEGDVEFTVTPNAAGRIRVFAEAAGVEPGSALIAVTDRLYVLPKARPPVGDVQWASFTQQEAPSVKLVIEDSGNDVFRRDGLLAQKFFVSLQTGDGADVATPSDLPVTLRVHKGKGRFEPRTLTIAANEAVSRLPAELKSSLGGEVEIGARSTLPEIAEARRPYTFEPGLRTTELLVTPLSPSALANGLDVISIDVQAVYRATADSERIVVRAEQEELAERVVKFRFKKGTARFVGGKSEIVIPKNESSGSIAIIATSPSNGVVIEAYSNNGLEERVMGEATVSFDLPWLQLLFAAVGGLLLPGINRKPPAAIALGSLGGLILYVLVFFGAVATGIFDIGRLAVAITKLPSENVLAAGVLGVVGYLATQKAFDLRKTVAKPKASKDAP